VLVQGFDTLPANQNKSIEDCLGVCVMLNMRQMAHIHEKESGDARAGQAVVPGVDRRVVAACGGLPLSSQEPVHSGELCRLRPRRGASQLRAVRASWRQTVFNLRSRGASDGYPKSRGEEQCDTLLHSRWRRARTSAAWFPCSPKALVSLRWANFIGSEPVSEPVSSGTVQRVRSPH